MAPIIPRGHEQRDDRAEKAREVDGSIRLAEATAASLKRALRSRYAYHGEQQFRGQFTADELEVLDSLLDLDETPDEQHDRSIESDVATVRRHLSIVAGKVVDAAITAKDAGEAVGFDEEFRGQLEHLSGFDKVRQAVESKLPEHDPGPPPETPAAASKE